MKKITALLLTLLFFLPNYQAFSKKIDKRNVSILDISRELAETLPDSDLGLHLLSTVNSSDLDSKAIFKNPITGEVSSYFVGEYITISDSKDIKIVKVFPCFGVIHTGETYAKISCRSESVKNYYFKPYALYGYQIADQEKKIIISKAYGTQFDKYIKTSCSKYDLDPNLVKAVIKAESNFNPDAVSPKNAEGLMQLMPSTAKQYGVLDSFDPSSNIEGGVKVLKDLIDHFDGDLKLALAGYNAGKGAVIKYGNKIPPYPETQQYVKKVIKFYDKLSSVATK